MSRKKAGLVWGRKGGEGGGWGGGVGGGGRGGVGRAEGICNESRGIHRDRKKAACKRFLPNRTPCTGFRNKARLKHKTAAAILLEDRVGGEYLPPTEPRHTI